MPTLTLPTNAFVRALALCAALALPAFACGGGSGGKATPTPPVLRVTNHTQCVIHIRFDNTVELGAAPPGVTTEFRDVQLDGYRYMQAESTKAIFRTFDLAQVRADGYAVTIAPAIDDHPCVDVPAP